MDQAQNTSILCSIHNKEFIAVDMSLPREEEPRFLCLLCLVSSNKTHKIKSIKDGESELAIKKSDFLREKQDQDKKNSDVLKDLESVIQQMKINYNQNLDKILENIKQQEARIKKEQEDLIIYLQSVDLERYFQMENQQTNPNAEMKNLIEMKINDLHKQANTDTWIQILEKIDDSIITLGPDEQVICHQKSEKQIKSTPSLPIACSTHSMEIIFLDLNQQKPKEHKIACALCVFDQVEFFILKTQFDNEKSKIKTAQTQLTQVQNKYQNKINEVNDLLDENLQLIEQKNQNEINNMNRDWLTLTREQIIQIADTLSKRSNQDNKQEDYFLDYKQKVHNLLDDTIQFLIVELHSCRLTKISGQEKNIMDSDITSSFIEYFNLDRQKVKTQKHISIQDQISIVKQSKPCISVCYFGGNQATLQMEFRKQIDKIKLDLSSSTSNSEQLQQQLKKLQEEKQRDSKSFQDKLNIQIKQTQELDKLNKELNQIIKQLENDKQQSQQQFQEKMKEIQKVKDDKQQQIEQLEKLKKEFDNNLQVKQTAIDQLNEQLKKIEQEKQILKSQSQNQQDQLQKPIQQLKEDNNKKDQLIQAKQKQIDQLNQQIKLLESEKENNQGKVDKVNLELQKIKEELNKQNKVLTDKAMQITQQQSEFDAKSKQNAKLIEEQNTKIKKNQGWCWGWDEHYNQMNTIDQLNQQIKSLKQEKDDQQKQAQIQQEKLNKQIKEFSATQNFFPQYQQQKQETEQLKVDLQNKNREIENLKANVQKITKELNEKQSTVTQLQQKQNQDQQLIQSYNKTISEQEQKLLKARSLYENPYDLLNRFNKKQNDWCQALTFNKDQTVMAAGCGQNKIAIYQFQQGQLVQKQILNDHTGGWPIFTLFFMAKTNYFLSGTQNEIGIWNYQNQKWQCLQLLKQAHSDLVNRVISNKNEDLLISCSNDKTIKFWRKKIQWECSETLTNHTDKVWSISLNESCTQLVSTGEDKQILISQSNNQSWTVIQTIKVNLEGFRICFIDDNLITFQPRNGTIMETYVLDQQNKKFAKLKEVPVLNDIGCDGYFPMMFNSRKQILLCKNGSIINFMRKKNNDFLVEQSIKFETTSIYGAMSDEGDYLVTWDRLSQDFQVRKQQ